MEWNLYDHSKSTGASSCIRVTENDYCLASHQSVEYVWKTQEDILGKTPIKIKITNIGFGLFWPPHIGGFGMTYKTSFRTLQTGIQWK